MPPAEVNIDGGPLVRVLAGRPYNLTCRATGGKPVPTIIWLTGSHRLNDSVHTIVEPQSNGKLQDVTSFLTVVPTRSDQGRKYECVVINLAMTSSLSVAARLEVLCKYALQKELKIIYKSLTEIRSDQQ